MGSGAAVIDKLFEAQALVPAIEETEIRLYGGEFLEAELAKAVKAEATIRLMVSERGVFRAGLSFDAGGGSVRGQHAQAVTSGRLDGGLLGE
ncbi:hypothetical protein [Arthrobacter sp. LjRoot14]|uniref:hypothetical protein n=1 Tax=Arthrobacter sp. LjRoot14 TaxID=3342265 RepID=UPI003ED07981